MFSQSEKTREELQMMKLTLSHHRVVMFIVHSLCIRVQKFDKDENSVNSLARRTTVSTCYHVRPTMLCIVWSKLFVGKREVTKKELKIHKKRKFHDFLQDIVVKKRLNIKTAI
jgi:hypothetical protein